MAETGVSNRVQRVLVGIVGVPLIVWLVWQGGIFFFVFMLLCALLAVNEFYRQLAVVSSPPPRWLFLVFSFVLQYNFYQTVLDPWILVLMCMMCFLVIELFRKAGSAAVNIGSSMTALLYVNAAFGSLLLVRGIEPTGFAYVLLLFICVWAADIMAYVGGSAFGSKFFKRKFFERVSPHKTWEGYIAGCAGSVSGAAATVFCGLGLDPVFTILAGFFVGLFSPLGDLIESMFKRDVGIKDSSTLIPGHGGILDRFDTVMFLAPLLYLYTFFAGRVTGL